MTTASPPTSTGPEVRRPDLSWLWVLVLGTTSYLLVLQALITTDNMNFVPSLILLGSIVVPASVLVFAASSGRRMLAPPSLIAWVSILGGILGTVAAGTLEYEALRRLGVLPILMVGLIEESAKLAVPLLILVFSRHRGSAVGAIVGVASGMGFATLETMGYGFTALAGGGLHAVEQTLLLRGLLAPAGHVAWTGTITAALWAVSGATDRRRALIKLVGVFAAAVFLHAAWDGSNNVWVHTGVGMSSFTALLVVLRRAHQRPAAHSMTQ